MLIVKVLWEHNSNGQFDRYMSCWFASACIHLGHGMSSVLHSHDERVFTLCVFYIVFCIVWSTCDFSCPKSHLIWRIVSVVSFFHSSWDLYDWKMFFQLSHCHSQLEYSQYMYSYIYTCVYSYLRINEFRKSRKNI